MSNVSNVKKKSTNVKNNTHYLKKMDMILPPYSGLNPWSKYVPMPPRQKKDQLVSL